MAAEEFRNCPACGSRNKIKWEFCVRCGEPMQDVPAGAATDRSPDEAPAETQAAPSTIGSTLLLVVVLAGGVVLLASGWRLEAPHPDPSAFTFGVPPSPQPAPSPAYSRTADMFAKAVRLAAGGDIDSAIPLFEQVNSEEPRTALYRAGYASALWTAGRRDLALTQFGAAADIEPVPNRLLFARRLQEAGQSVEAIRQYDLILRDNPQDVAVASEFGTVLNEAGEHARAAEVFRSALAGTANPEVRAGLAYALENTGDAGGAAKIYQQLLVENSGRVLVRARLAAVMARQGDPEAAARLCQDGLKSTPDAPLLHTGLGGAYDDMGRWKEAAAEYRESVRLAPDSQWAKRLTDRAAALEKLAEGGTGS